METAALNGPTCRSRDFAHHREDTFADRDVIVGLRGSGIMLSRLPI